MKKAIAFLLLLCWLVSGAFAGIFIAEPKDKLTTFDDVIMLTGRGRDLKVLKVNGIDIPFDKNGGFKCGLVLRRGKNYVEVRAQDIYGESFVKTMRILGLKTYPDIEALYEGEKHWARQPIVYLSSLRFIEGYPDDNYYPGNPITRGEFATWIGRIKNLTIPALTDDVFFDVPKEHWRAPYIKAVVDAGYMSSYDTLTFGIDDPVSRRRAAEIVTLSEGIELAKKLKPLFIDVPKAERGAAPIYIGKEKGLLKGVSKAIPVYEPDRALTRAEAAVLLARFQRSQNAVKWLFNFGNGYGRNSYCGVNVAPKIEYFYVSPDQVRVKEKTNVHLEAKIAARAKFSSISNVKVDLTELGGLPDVMLYDDGSHGDRLAEDLVYSLNISVEPKESGGKLLTVTAVDRLGWEGEEQATLLVLE